jgi:small conductance mechanosensitive channel
MASFYDTQPSQSSSSWSDSEWIQYLLENPFFIKFIEIILAIIVFAFLIFVSKLISNLIKKRVVGNISHQSRDDDSIAKVANLVWDIVFYALTMFSLYICLNIIWLDAGLLLWWLSIGIWFAFKEVLWNLISGLLIFSTKEYKIWEIVEIKLNNLIYLGKIEEITIRYVVLRTFDLRRVVIPNINFIWAQVKTYTSEDTIRYDSIFAIPSNNDLEKTKNLIIAKINTLEFISNTELTQILIEKFDDKHITLKALYSFNPNCNIPWHVIKSEVNKTILALLKSYQFDIV